VVFEILELAANAKINISLDVIGKREDGYHDVKMIMQSIALHDKIKMEITDKDISIECNCPWIPTDKSNTAYKAAELLINNFKIKKGVKIIIDKNIPVAAGLAGGSSDAAAVLKGVNELFHLNIDQFSMLKFGKEIGADVPYCLRGGTMLSEGIGEILTELEPFPATNIVLVKPKINVSTAWAYKNLNIKSLTRRPDTELLLSAIKVHDLNKIAKNMVNVLEEVTVKKHGLIEEIKKRLLDLGAMGSIMSGSGPTVFAIFMDSYSAQKAFSEIKSENWECYLTHTV